MSPSGHNGGRIEGTDLDEAVTGEDIASRCGMSGAYNQTRDNEDKTFLRGHCAGAPGPSALFAPRPHRYDLPSSLFPSFRYGLHFIITN